MSKIELTQELSDRLKMERLNLKMTAATLSNELGISTGRLSNIENNKIKEMDLDLFNKIIKILIPDENRKEYIETLLNDSLIRFSKRDIEKQDWFTVLDLQIRKVSITKELLDWLKSACNELSITPVEIMQIVNKNNISDIDEDFLKAFNNAKYNEVSIYRKDNISKEYIKFNLDLCLLDDILNEKITDIAYIFMAGIVSAFTQIPGSKYSHSDPYIILSNNKFYRLIEKKHIISKDAKLKELGKYIPSPNLSEQDNTYIQHINTLIRHLNKFNDMDSSKTNARLNSINKNFDTDAGFALVFSSLPIHKLNDLDKSKKLAFLKETKEKIETLYANTKNEEIIEEYDI